MKYAILIFSIIANLQVSAQKHSDRQTLSFDVQAYDEVHIYNKHGAVSVEGTNDRNAVFKIERTLKAKSKKKLEEVISEIYFDTIVLDNVLIVYINNPYYSLEGEYNDRFMYYNSNENGMWDNWNKHKTDFNFDLNVSLPLSTNLVVSTHRGELKVEGMKGKLAAWNHHNSVLLKNVSDVYYASSHHGDVTVDMTDYPSTDIDFKSHHGDIKVSVPGEPSVQVSFDSHHGSFYTDFDWVEMPAKLEKMGARSKKKAKYKLGDKTVVSIGDGNHRLSFNTHHGDMYLLQL